MAHPKSWGEETHRLTPGRNVVDFVLDVGGNETLPKSPAAVRVDRMVLVVGPDGESSVEYVPMFAALLYRWIIRGILAASCYHFRKLLAVLTSAKCIPAVDDVTFELAEAMSTFRRLKEKIYFA